MHIRHVLILNKLLLLLLLLCVKTPFENAIRPSFKNYLNTEISKLIGFYQRHSIMVHHDE